MYILLSAARRQHCLQLRQRGDHLRIRPGIGIVTDRLKKLRAGQSQEKVIEPTKLNLSQYEALLRTPSLDSIYILCEYFSITLREFFDVEGFDIPSKK